MVSQIVNKFQDAGRFRVAHLAFRFTKSTQQARRASLGKLTEVLMVWLRLVRIRFKCGKIDCVLYPIGGPQLVPVVRDVLLLPVIFFLSKKVVLHFHAGGVPETIDKHPRLISALAKWLYSRVDAAISLTEWGCREPQALGISDVYAVSLDFADAFDPALISRSHTRPMHILSMGHLCEEKGTVILLQALGRLRKQGVGFKLTLVGECLFPFTEDELRQVIVQCELADVVVYRGVLVGQEKWQCYAESDLFVFPSLARESFGIVMAEAMMWALPVLAFDWRANREVLGYPPEALLAEERSVDGLTEALRAVFACREDLDTLGRTMRGVFLERYSAKKHASCLVDVLEAVCKS